MMMNLFSEFNPTTSPNWSMNWLLMIMILSATSMEMWKMNSMISSTYMKSKMMINNMMSKMMKKMNMNFSIMMTGMFMTMLTMNSLSLFPYIYPWTSMITVTMSISLPMWISAIMSKFNLSKTAAHLVPSNTPMPLIPFMVVVEMISMLIQPLTLSIRMTANIMAGHIIINLLTKMYSMLTMIILIPPHLMLNSMELGVALIQSYVFIMLISMYTK